MSVELGAVRVQCAPWVTWGPGKTELVLFNGNDGSYHSLNESATRIWLELSQGHQPAEIGKMIAGLYGVSVALVAPDVAEFVRRSLYKNLLVAE